jgi:hypothetical protein
MTTLKKIFDLHENTITASVFRIDAKFLRFSTPGLDETVIIIIWN